MRVLRCRRAKVSRKSDTAPLPDSKKKSPLTGGSQTCKTPLLSLGCSAAGDAARDDDLHHSVTAEAVAGKEAARHLTCGI